MTSTERVMTALRHSEPDRVPVHESFWPGFIEQWRREKGLPPEADIYEYYGLDLPGTSRVYGDQSPWPSQARELERGDGWRLRRTGWGDIVRSLDSMSVDHVVAPPLVERADLDRMPAFEPADLDLRYAGIAAWVRKLAAKGFCCFAKTGGPFSRTWRFRGFAQFLVDMVEDPGFATELLTRQTDLLMATTRENLRRGGHPKTVVWIADDCAYRTGPLFSPAVYERLIQPQMARLCAMIHETGRLVAFESEGHVRPFLPLILDAGVDILTNMEPRAGMDVVALRREFGRRVAFIGTMCNTVVLPRGTETEIRAEVRRTLEAGVGGGAVFGSAHSIGTDVPIRSYEVFLDTLREFGTYPLTC
jgi:uroporphyrinogen decarboxylase